MAWEAPTQTEQVCWARVAGGDAEGCGWLKAYLKIELTGLPCELYVGKERKRGIRNDAKCLWPRNRKDRATLG